MSRRIVSQIELDMFPFLSVLCAVIGILMLFMLIVISTRVMALQPEPPAGPGPAAEPPPPQLAGVSEERHRQLQTQVEHLGRQLVTTQEKLHALREARAQLLDLIAAKRDEIELGAVQLGGRQDGAHLGRPEEVNVVPDTSRQVNKHPIRVEITEEGYTVHPQKQFYPREQLGQPGSPLVAFLKDVDEERDKRYLLLLVHPNGAKSYQQFRKHLLENFNKTVTKKKEIVPGIEMTMTITLSRIDVGVEPFSNDWLLVPDAAAD